MSINGLLFLTLALAAFCTLTVLSVVAAILFNEILSWMKRYRRSRTKEVSKALQGGSANPG